MFIPYFIPYTLCFDILYESFVLHVHLVILWDMCIYCVDHISSWYIMYNDVMTHSPITVLNPRIQKERKTGRSIWGMGSQWRGLEKKQTGDWDEDKRQAQGERFSAMVDGEWNQRKVQLTWDSQRHLQKQVGERAATSNNGAWAPRPSRQARYVAISHLWFQHWDRGSWWDFDQPFPNGRCVEWWSRPLTCQEERHTKEEEEEDKGKVVKVQKERQTVFVIKFQFVQLQVCEHSLEQQQQQQEDQEIKKRQEEIC